MNWTLWTRRAALALLTGATLAGAAGCAVRAVPSAGARVSASETMAVLPLQNATEVAFADRRAHAILLSLLQQRGIKALTYPVKTSDNPLEATQSPGLQESLQWARREGARWAMTGTVTEWRYKSGVDGEPAVGITLSLVDVASGEVVWSATGARTGWGYQALAAVGQSQIEDLLRGLVVQAVATPR
ncbi:MAG TPA: penicillin-binding protein activator LpoB [Burkholderiaceae bacterium]|nr:penicillin-binding protein activator LpoB [Burkholderiaceae bacterium]